VRRIKQLHPNRENFKLFTKFNFRNPNQVMLVIDKLKGYDLIVIDSWTASHKGGNDNEEVAQLDTEVFQPIIDGTGASLLILDNTGHSTYSEDGEHKQDHARGASAKGDKMEVTLWFDRPIKGDNYRTRISVMKMRLDHPIPEPMVVVTPRDRIEFFKSEHVNGQVTIESQSAWPTSNEVLVDTLEETTVPDADSDGLQLETPELTLPEKLALARLKDALGATELPDEE
jgi:hypothetical protein